jgi:hypothetical protein
MTPIPFGANRSADNTVAPQRRQPPLSGYMTAILLFLTHGFVNAALLGPWNPIRCGYWNRVSCSDDEAGMMNWLAYGTWHLFVLLAMLGSTAVGRVVAEQRLAYFCAVIMLSNLSNGIFVLHQLNQPLATVQIVWYVGLLFTILSATTATTTDVLPPSGPTGSCRFNTRRLLPTSSVALVSVFVLSTACLLYITFGNGGPQFSSDHAPGPTIDRILANTAVCQWF